MADTPKRATASNQLDYETPVEPSIGQRAASGATWLASQAIISRVTSLGSQLVLAWLLSPGDFGKIGLVYTITAFATQLTYPGVDDVLLQKQKRIHRWANAALWLSLACSIAGALVMIVAGITVVSVALHLGNEAYGDSSLIWMILILALGAPFNAAALVPAVVLRSEMRFARLAGMGLAEVMAQQILTILFAAIGFGAYSFVIPMPLVAAGRSLALWMIVRPPVRMNPAIHRWPALTSATGWVMGQRLFYSAISQGDYILLGAIYADQDLVGKYFFAFMLSTQVIRLLCDNAGAVLLPALNVIRDDPPRLRHAAQRAGRALALMVVPIVTLQILLAGPTVRLLFAAKWEPAIPIIQWLSIGQLLYWSIWPIAAILLAGARFRDSFVVWCCGAIAFFVMVFPATLRGGVLGTAIGVSLWCWVMSALAALTTFRSPSGMMWVISCGRVAWLGSAVGSLPVVALLLLVPRGVAGDVVALGAGATMFLIIYLLIVSRLDRESVDMLTKQGPAVLRRIRRYLPLGSAA